MAVSNGQRRALMGISALHDITDVKTGHKNTVDNMMLWVYTFSIVKLLL